MSETLSRRSITFFRGADAASIDDDGMMSPPDVPAEVREAMDLTPLHTASQVKVLFKGEGPDGFSLVYAKFGPGYKLPRHSHNADCLYYVISGQARMGSRILEPGDGLFVKADQPYAYQAGPDGIEILEFRAKTSIDMKVFDRTVERWTPIVAAAAAAAMSE